MQNILRVIIFVGALWNAYIGLNFFFAPEQTGLAFGLEVANLHGSSSLRADMTAFFMVAVAYMAWGAWKKSSNALLVPLMLFGIAFAGRLLSLLTLGAYDGWYIHMTVEAAHVIVAALAMLMWREN